MISTRTILRGLSIAILSVTLAGCGLFGGDDGPNLGGDLSWEVEGEDGLTYSVTRSAYDGSSYTGGTVVSFQTLEGGSASGDLEDGDYKAYRLAASVLEDESSASLTLKLLNDGNVIGETSEPNENGQWVIEKGDFPDADDFQ